MPMLTSHNVDFRTKKIIRDRERHCILIKGIIHKEATALLSTVRGEGCQQDDRIRSCKICGTENYIIEIIN